MGVSERMPQAAAAASGPFDLVVAGERVLVDGAFTPPRSASATDVIARIAPLGSGLAAARIVRLADDEVLIPGLVDTHVHVNEPGRTEWEGFATATRAAAAGGVTTIVDMPLNSIPPTTSVAALQVKRRAAEGDVFVDVGFWGGLVPDNLGDLGPLIDEGVFGFKCFLVDSGVAEFPPVTADHMEAAMRALAAADSLLIVHAEDAAVIGAAPHPHSTDYGDFLASRPPARRARRDRRGHRVVRAHRCARAHPAPQRGERPRGDRAGEARRGAAQRRDLPALPHAHRGGGARRRHRVQVLPAHPRRREP